MGLYPRPFRKELRIYLYIAGLSNGVNQLNPVFYEEKYRIFLLDFT
jgi:hypothetical protein